MKLRVKNVFRDKTDGVTIYAPGELIEIKDVARAKDLIERDLCEAESAGKSQGAGKKAAENDAAGKAAEKPQDAGKKAAEKDAAGETTEKPQDAGKKPKVTKNA